LLNRLPNPDDLFFLRLISTGSEYHPTPGDLVLQEVIPKYDLETDDLSPLEVHSVTISFGENVVSQLSALSDFHFISLPILEGPTSPQHFPYIEMDDDLISIRPQDEEISPISKHGNHF
jgi:hypothetical protein